LIYIKSRTGIPPDEGVPHLRGKKKKPKRVLHICLNMMMDVNLQCIIPRKMEEKEKEKKRSKRMWRRRRV
jgi:hypothetical protein